MNQSPYLETPILLSPSLAKKLGVDSALMLSVLQNRVRYTQGQTSNNYTWYTLTKEDVVELLPFWDARDIQRVSTLLREQGQLLLATAPFEQSDFFKFAFNLQLQNQVTLTETEHSKSTHRFHNNKQPISSSRDPKKHNNHSRNISSQTDIRTRAINEPLANEHAFLSKNFIAPNWQPDQATLDQIAQHAIHKEFCYEQVPEFVTYWRERGEAHRSWGAKFLQHVIRQWRSFEETRYKKDQESGMRNGWKPSLDAMDILLKQAEIPQEFIEDAIPEFILYWQERGDRLSTWNSKFIQHVRLQWKKYHSSIEHSTDPRPITNSWQPSSDVYDVLRMANIDLPFAQSLIPEFVIYWKDSHQLHTSWNTRFLQHAKRQWAQRHNLSIQNNAQNKSLNSNSQRSTREMSLEEQLTDRSWAN